MTNFYESNTERGFQLVEFSDYFGEKCSIQQSSAAIYTEPGAGALWVGRNYPERKFRMHLDDPQVRILCSYLQHWLRTGRLFDES